MRSIVEPRFKRMLRKLPRDVQAIAHQAIAEPGKPRYRLHKLYSKRRLRPHSWAIRVDSQTYRAIAEKLPDGTLSWYWIGTHEAYNGMIGK